MRAAHCLCVLWVLFSPWALAAQYHATARLRRQANDVAEEDRAASKHTINVKDQPFVYPTVSALFAQVPGARLTSSGGYEGFAGLRLRGAEPEHTQLYLGNLPLDAEDAAFDFSSLPVFLFDRLEFFTGGVPFWLGTSTMGGAVRLLSESERSNYQVRAMAGSFETYGVDAAARNVDSKDGIEWQLAAGGLSSAGDYPYLYDNGTTLRSDDDVTLKRANGDVHDVYSLSRVRTAGKRQSFEAILLGFFRQGGIAHPAVPQDNQAERAYARFNLVAQHEIHSSAKLQRKPRWLLQSTASAAYIQSAVRDPYAQVRSVPLLASDRTLRARGRVAALWQALPWMSWQALAHIDQAAFQPEDTLSAAQVHSSSRTGYSVGGELTINPDWLNQAFTLRSSLRLEGLHATLFDIRQATLDQQARLTQSAATWRVAAAYQPNDAYLFSLSVYRGLRFASLRELFGDRAFVLGNTELSPERSYGVDAGVRVGHEFSDFGYSLGFHSFAQKISELIRYERVAPYVIRPDNIASATIIGAEASALVQAFKLINLNLSLTWLSTRDASERELPFRPPLKAYGRLGFLWRKVSSWINQLSPYIDADYVSQNFADPANQAAFPARATVGLGAALETLNQRGLIALSVYNLLDSYQYDLVGFPLPTRQINLSFTWRDALQ